MLKQIVFGSFYHPFQDGYKKFRKTDIVALASPGQDIIIIIIIYFLLLYNVHGYFLILTLQLIFFFLQNT